MLIFQTQLFLFSGHKDAGTYPAMQNKWLLPSYMNLQEGMQRLSEGTEEAAEWDKPIGVAALLHCQIKPPFLGIKVTCCSGVCCDKDATLPASTFQL